MLKKIWSDPVGSKVISAGILAICAYIYSLFSTDTFVEIIDKIWHYQLGLGWTIVTITFLLIIQGFWNRTSNSSDKGDSMKTYTNQTKENFRKANTKLLFTDDILVRFTTWFASGNGLPFIADVVAYCNLHPVPMRMSRQGCPEHNCVHNNYQIDLVNTKHTIESILIDEWEKSNV